MTGPEAAAELRDAIAEFHAAGGVALGPVGRLVCAVELVADRCAGEAVVVAFPGHSVRVPEPRRSVR